MASDTQTYNWNDGKFVMVTKEFLKTAFNRANVRKLSTNQIKRIRLEAERSGMLQSK
jgi:aspartyl/asparaginyl beta-hydroxylase (cupin superfamily)